MANPSSPKIKGWKLIPLTKEKENGHLQKRPSTSGVVVERSRDGDGEAEPVRRVACRGDVWHDHLRVGRILLGE